MGDATHYLRLAYLAEMAIVFNLAYFELKWRDAILAKKKIVPGDTFAPDAIKSLICKKTKCRKCYNDNKVKAKFEEYDVDYISKAQNALWAELSENQENNIGSVKLLKRAWLSFSECSKFSKSLMWVFHAMIREEMDRWLAILFLGITIIILTIITLADSKLDLPFNVLYYFGIWSSVDIWMRVFTPLLICLTLLPCFFWFLWHKFLGEYECLSLVLAFAYQSKIKKNVDTTMDDIGRHH